MHSSKEGDDLEKRAGANVEEVHVFDEVLKPLEV